MPKKIIVMKRKFFTQFVSGDGTNHGNGEAELVIFGELQVIFNRIGLLLWAFMNLM